LPPGVYGAQGAGATSGEPPPARQSSFDETQFELQEDGDYSEIIDTIKPVARREGEGPEFEDGEYMEFDFIDNVDKRETSLPAYLEEGEKADYEEFDIIDSSD
jgi:hypothetical protein